MKAFNFKKLQVIYLFPFFLKCLIFCIHILLALAIGIVATESPTFQSNCSPILYGGLRENEGFLPDIDSLTNRYFTRLIILR